jgi:hypothetical protein
MRHLILPVGPVMEPCKAAGLVRFGARDNISTLYYVKF